MKRVASCDTPVKSQPVVTSATPMQGVCLVVSKEGC